MSEHTGEQFAKDLRALGLTAGDTVIVHSSFKALGGIEGGAKTVFDGFMEVLGEEGTLLLPALSYENVGYDQPVFDRAETVSCIGFLPEYFRTRVPGVVRSLHATHSVCAKGKRATEMIKDHELDLTPVGEHSPFRKLPRVGGKILFLGCSADHNTSMHGVEELARPPYVFNEKPVCYLLRDGDRTIRQTAIHHGFRINGILYDQVYSRILDLLPEKAKSFGKVLDADCWLLSAAEVWEIGQRKMEEEPFYFVEPVVSPGEGE